jgi:hypothetical protein
MKKKLIFLILFLLILVSFSFFFGLYEVRFFKSRASVSQASFSVDNSYLFVSPLRAKANGQEKIRITVFVLNNQGLGVLGKEVFLSPNTDLSVDIIQGQTDNFGKAVFDVTSTKPGEYYLEVSVDGQKLPQKAHLSFY